MQSESSEAVLARSVGACEAALSWQVWAASAMVLALDTQEEEARGTAMEQAESSAEVSATDDACAGADVEEGCWWWWCVCV